MVSNDGGDGCHFGQTHDAQGGHAAAVDWCHMIQEFNCRGMIFQLVIQVQTHAAIPESIYVNG